MNLEIFMLNLHVCGYFSAYHANSHFIWALAHEGQVICIVHVVRIVDWQLRAALAVLQHAAAAEAGQVVGLLGGGVRFVLSARQQLTWNQH